MNLQRTRQSRKRGSQKTHRLLLPRSLRVMVGLVVVKKVTVRVEPHLGSEKVFLSEHYFHFVYFVPLKSSYSH